MSSSFKKAMEEAKPMRKNGQKPGKKEDVKDVKPAKAERQPATARDRWLRATKDVATATGLREKIGDANSLLDDPESVRQFATIVGELDVLAVYKLSLEILDGKPVHSSERDAEEAWLAMSWDDQEARLAKWPEAGKLLETFHFWKTKEGNAFAQDSLCNVVSRFYRPLRHVSAFGGLKSFLEEAVTEGLLSKVSRPDPRQKSEFGVYIPGQDDRGPILYLPKKGIKLAAAGWIFVKEAEARTLKTQSDMDELRARETPGITPVKISNGFQGFMFVQLGATQAVLLESNSQSGWPTVKVADSVNMRPDQIPDDEREWDDKLHKPRGNSKWAWIAKGVEEWKNRKLAARNAQRREANDRTLPLTKLATFPTRFEHQGLTQMLKGEPGVVAMWVEHFRWGKEEPKKEAFFGVAIERRPDGTFFLLEVVSRHPFPMKKLIGSQLPLSVDEEKPDVRLQQISIRDGAVYAGLKMVEVLMRLRLHAETPAEDPYDQDNATDKVADVPKNNA